MLKREPYIDAVVGPQAYHQLPEIFSKLKNSRKKINLTDFDVIQKFDKLNTFLKVYEDSNNNHNSNIKDSETPKCTSIG